jgi:SNF2 family DNA or RNA helicase
MSLTMYPWQKKEVEEHALTPKRALFCSPRTGKTLATIESLARYISESPEGVRRVLVVSPLTYVSDWADYLERFGPVERLYKKSAKDAHAFIADYNRSKTRKAGGVESIVISFERLANITKERRNAEGIVTSTSKTGCIDQLLNWRPDAVIIDEAHRISGVSAKQARACRRLAWAASWVRTLTGTPIPNHVGSLWGHMVCVDPDTWDAASYGRFKNNYLQEDRFIPGKILGWKSEAIKSTFEANIRDNACVVHREAVFGPDSWTTNERRVEMPAKSWEVYRNLAKKWIAELESGATAEANHMLTRMMRLQQVACGFVSNADGGIQELHTAKADAICDDLSEIIAQGEKVVIFYKYVHEGKMIREVIEKKFRHTWFRHIDGTTGADARKTIASAFNSSKNAAIILAQIKTLSEGVSLAEAAHVFYASQTFSFVAEEQSRDRVYKRGLDGNAAARTVTYYRVSGTIEDYVNKIVQGKLPMHQAIMGITAKDMGI